MTPAQPYTVEELRNAKQTDLARVRATAHALRMAQERLAHSAASIGGDAVLRAMQAQREACARAVRDYPASTTLGDQLGRIVRSVPLAEVRP